MRSVACPSCGVNFEEAPNRVVGGLRADVRRELSSSRAPERQIDDATSIKCPHCGSVFEGSYRFFGILTARGMRVLASVFFTGVVVAIWWFVATDLK